RDRIIAHSHSVERRGCLGVEQGIISYSLEIGTPLIHGLNGLAADPVNLGDIPIHVECGLPKGARRVCDMTSQLIIGGEAADNTGRCGYVQVRHDRGSRRWLTFE